MLKYDGTYFINRIPVSDTEMTFSHLVLHVWTADRPEKRFTVSTRYVDLLKKKFIKKITAAAIHQIDPWIKICCKGP